MRVFGEHHVSQSQLYKLSAHSPRSTCPPQSTPASGPLEVRCGSLRGLVEAQCSMAKAMYTVSWVTSRLTKSPHRAEVGLKKKNSTTVSD